MVWGLLESISARSPFLKSSKSPTGNSENAGNDTDEEIEAAFREAQEAGEQLSMVGYVGDHSDQSKTSIHSLLQIRKTFKISLVHESGVICI